VRTGEEGMTEIADTIGPQLVVMQANSNLELSLAEFSQRSVSPSLGNKLLQPPAQSRRKSEF